MPVVKPKSRAKPAKSKAKSSKPRSPPAPVVPARVAPPTEPVVLTAPAPVAPQVPDAARLTSPWGRAPTVTIPAVPAAAVPQSMRPYMGYRPTRTELSVTSGAVQDLVAFTDSVALLGTSPPKAAVVADALRVAFAWRALRKPLEALNAYVRFGDADAWKTALTLMEQLKPHLVLAVTKRPPLAQQYPALFTFAGVGKETAKRANVTKKKKAKQKAGEAQKAAVAAAKAAAKADADAQAKGAKKGVTITI